jgi:hypothetical protein
MVRVGTANLPARKMTDDELSVGISDVLAERPRYLALQEVGPDRNNVLRAVAAEYGYRMVRGKGGPPILYDAHGTEVIRDRTLTLSRASFVGYLPGRKSTLPASKATEVHFEDDELGDVVVIDAHLDAEVQVAGNYRTDKAHLPRVRRHKRQCRRLRRRGRHHIAKGRMVYICLDGNFDRLRLLPLVSCWAGRKSVGTLQGPQGNWSERAVDIVFAETEADAVSVVETGSDHRAVVCTYR